jgi:hypothetical protein
MPATAPSVTVRILWFIGFLLSGSAGRQEWRVRKNNTTRNEPSASQEDYYTLEGQIGDLNPTNMLCARRMEAGLRAEGLGRRESGQEAHRRLGRCKFPNP